MEEIEARILLKNLMKRISRSPDSWDLTEGEIEALQYALVSLGENPPPASPVPTTATVSPPKAESIKPLPQFPPEEARPEIADEAPVVELPIEQEEADSSIEIDFSTLKEASPSDDRRLCIDFGTAMSKVTLVRDPTPDHGYEDIVVLKLGEPGDQDLSISETMLISSVYIDNEGLLWFGQEAVSRSHVDAQASDRQRLDNIKRYLSEEGMDELVTSRFNPTDMTVTYREMLLAYLMFLTWTVNHCLQEEGEQLNLKRRFAMPCFEGSKSAETARILSKMLGEAQVLADTFFSTLKNGIPLKSFLQAIKQIREAKPDYKFIGESITEPLGVAGSIVNWQPDPNAQPALLMVIDVGAGTSDFSMFKIGTHAESGRRTAVEVKGAADGISEAGNYLDQLLQGLILRKAGVDSSHGYWINIQGNLALDLRNYKETLFREGEVTVRLFTDELVEIDLKEFLALDQVKKFGDSLRECRDRILESVDRSWIHGAPGEVLAIALTGGGAGLPMVKELAKGKVTAQGKELRIVQTPAFPRWLQDDYDELERDYPRIAASLGGARAKLIESAGVASITAGDIKGPPDPGGSYDPIR